MSSHQIPQGLTRGYSNIVMDSLFKKADAEAPTVLTNDDLDRMDKDQEG